MKKTGSGNMIKERREKLGLSQAELARRVGISQPTMLEIERGGIKKSKYLPEIYRELGLDLNTGRPLMTMAGGPHLPTNDDEQPGRATCPVYSMRPSPTGEMMLTSEPTEYVVKPPLLTTVTEALGIGIGDDTNCPVYKRGDIVFVHPHQEPIIGSDVVMRPIASNDLRVAVGELVEENAHTWGVKPYNTNPDKKPDHYKKSEWRCERIVGKYNRR